MYREDVTRFCTLLSAELEKGSWGDIDPETFKLISKGAANPPSFAGEYNVPEMVEILEAVLSAYDKSLHARPHISLSLDRPISRMDIRAFNAGLLMSNLSAEVMASADDQFTMIMVADDDNAEVLMAASEWFYYRKYTDVFKTLFPGTPDTVKGDVAPKALLDDLHLKEDKDGN